MARPFNLPASIGADLKVLREQCQLGQKEVQRASGLDQSRISRIEKGEIVPTAADVSAYLDALPAAHAKRYKDYLRANWRFLRQPTFFHPDLEALTRAERSLAQIDGAFKEEDERSPIRGQMHMFRTTLLRVSGFLEAVEHVVAFIGPVGVGKSTAISHSTGLTVPSQTTGLMDRCVLEVAGGRTTLCEVQVRRAQVARIGILVEPQTEEEVHLLVGDLCAGLIQEASATFVEDQRRGVATETETALRNMAGLARKNTVGPDKKRLTSDPLRDLAKVRSGVELRVEVITRMNLARRTRCELWYEGIPGKGELEWLKKTFSDVNRGRIDDVPLPRRIDVLLPRPVIEGDLDISIVDTKGIDDVGSALRPDLEVRLTDPRTVSVLCSGFTDAPNAVTQVLLKHLRDIGATEALRERLLVLVLPQHDQPLDVMEDGARVESRDHGYEVKERDAVEQLRRDHFPSPPPFIFYDALVDGADAVVQGVAKRVRSLRDAYVAQIAAIEQNVALLVADKEQARAIAAQARVLEQLALFIERHEDVPRRSRRAHAEVVRVMRQGVHPGVLWATTRRRGRYQSFNVYFRFGAAVGADATERSSKFFVGLKEFLEQWKTDPAFEGASGLLDTLETSLEFWRMKFIEACRQAGTETFRPPLLDPSADADKLWRSTESAYGTGVGYRDSVADSFNDWFDAGDREDLHGSLEDRIREAWKAEVVEPLRRLCSPESGLGRSEGGCVTEPPDSGDLTSVGTG